MSLIGCYICYHPFRKELETAYRMGIPVTQIYRKYREHLGGKSVWAITAVIKKHMDKEHLKKSIRTVVLLPNASLKNQNAEIKPETIKDYASKMLEIGRQRIEIDPDSIKMSDIVSAQRVMLEEQKLKLSEKELDFQMARLFSGLIPAVNTIEEAEVVEEKFLGEEENKNDGGGDKLREGSPSQS